VLSIHSYAIPSTQLSKGSGLSIEFGEEKEREVHVETEVRKWLRREGAEVVLSVRGKEGEWMLVDR
jgi:hypothetical protein